MKNQHRFMKPLAPIRRAKLDSVALVPGNLLPCTKQWDQVTGGLPKDELVIALPERDTQQRKTLSTVAEPLQKSGHHVHVVQEQELNSLLFGELMQERLGR